MKKALLLSFITYSFIAHSQDCEKLVSENIDKVTGQITTSLIEPIIISNDGGKTGFEISLHLSSKGDAMALLLTINGAGPCVDRGDEINILFTDDTRLTLKYTGDFACDPSLFISFGGYAKKLEELQQLKTKKIATLRGWTRGKVMQMDLTEKQATLVMNSFSCMANKLK